MKKIPKKRKLSKKLCKNEKTIPTHERKKSQVKKQIKQKRKNLTQE